ncbi:hypothetical protein AWC38_SpisGene9041 [Stylophora pistillata]|uniref:Integrase catalytic domain-containing protein n=1 Tax=Stylophora pistillata TaxID=50429 RepID=A0A2B4SCL5_STYPI|nr:hypothetical protein AWC38_SpisGene9041 [Stylophora pistillata]
MKLKQVENKLSIERQVYGEEMKKLQEKIFLAREPRALSVKQQELPGRRTQGKSDSFLYFKPNEVEVALMNLIKQTEELRKEKQILESKIAELEKTLKAERTKTMILERPLERQRRNSDSDLHFKARKEGFEQTENQPEEAFGSGAQMDLDKHLNEVVISKLEGRLRADKVVKKQIFQSFGIDPREFYRPRRGFGVIIEELEFGKIVSMFLETPVKVLQEVFEALQLYDLIDLLEEGKPRTTRLLRPALPLQEIEKLRNPGDLPISYHSSVAVLIIDFSVTSDTVGIEKFFKGLNRRSETKIAAIFQVSISTLQRRRREFGLSDELEKFSDISDDESDIIYATVSGNFQSGPLTPNIGRRRFIGTLRSRGLRVQRWRVSECLHRVDPVGTTLRWRMAIRRRKYYVPTPNSLWHIDSGHKLIRFKLITHVCFDRKTRLLVYVHCCNNNKADTVLSLFGDVVQRMGLPSRLRSDYGMENIYVAQYMLEHRGEGRGSIITGSSVHNCRVERSHRDIYAGVLTSIHVYLRQWKMKAF